MSYNQMSVVELSSRIFFNGQLFADFPTGDGPSFQQFRVQNMSLISFSLAGRAALGFIRVGTTFADVATNEVVYPPTPITPSTTPTPMPPVLSYFIYISKKNF